MRRVGWFLALIVAGAVLFRWSGCWEDPRVRSLFGSDRSDRTERPLRFLEDLPAPVQPPEQPIGRQRSAPSRETRPSPVRQRPETAPGTNQVPNAVVARTLLQILRAKGLASGISLAVTDGEVQVYGTVPSEERLREILAVLEQGRETRRINTDGVTIEATIPEEGSSP